MSQSLTEQFLANKWF